MIKTPLIIFGFNRPDKLQELLNRLLQTPFEQAYLFCDAPRNDSDRALCLETQNIARSFANKHPIQLAIRETNYGLSSNLVNGISSVLSNHPQAIIFEDDIHPREGCVAFLDLALDTFKDREDIFSIGCYHRPLAPKQYISNIHMSRRFNCWGWATWATRWQKLQQVLESSAPIYSDFRDVPEVAGADLRKYAKLNQVNGRELMWDVRTALCCLKNGWWQVQPRDCLIENVGFDGSGTNCTANQGMDKFDSLYNPKTYCFLDPHIKPNSKIIYALEATYTDPRITPIRRWRRKWKERIRGAFRKLFSPG